jgi:hypothetical protein
VHHEGFSERFSSWLRHERIDEKGRRSSARSKRLTGGTESQVESTDQEMSQLSKLRWDVRAMTHKGGMEGGCLEQETRQPEMHGVSRE